MKLFNYIRLHFCFALCIYGLSASCQLNETDFVLYSQQDGLSNNNVTGIVQDKLGYLWVSTKKGLNRYNGTEFFQLHSDSSQNSLPVEDISKIQWIDDDHLAASSLGVYILNTRKGNSFNIIIPPGELKYAFKVNAVMSIQSNKKGDIFILTRSGFYHYNSNHQLIFRFDYYKKEHADTATFVFGNSLTLLTENIVMIKAVNGLHIYNVENRQLKKLNAIEYPLYSGIVNVDPTEYIVRQLQTGLFLLLKLRSDSIFYFDHLNKLMVGNRTVINPLLQEFRSGSNLNRINDTLYYVTGFNNGFFKMIVNENGRIQIDPHKYFAEYYCSTVFKDKENRFWVGTNKGLFKEEREKIAVEKVQILSDSLHHFPAPLLQQVYVHKDKIYAGSRRDGGLLIFDKNSMRLLKRISFKKLWNTSDNTYSISKAIGDTLLIGTNGPLMWFNTMNFHFGVVNLENWHLNSDWVSSQFMTREKNIWIATNSSNLYLYKIKENKFSEFKIDKSVIYKIITPRYITEDSGRNIWMAGHGLCRLNRSTGTIDQLIDSFPYIKFPRKEIDALITDKNNTLWFGNVYNGLMNYDFNKKTFLQFTNQNGLPDNIITALKIVNDKLWIATTSGIAQLDLHTRKIASYGKDDGFPAVPLVTGNNFFFDSTANQLYIGFDNYLVRFNPDSLLKQKNPPLFFIESVKLANSNTFFHPSGKISIPFSENNFSVRINSINYNDVENQQIAYRLLDKKDSTWKILSGQPLINFSNLSPGAYPLQVKLSASNNRWPEQLRMMTIVITPPFWQTWWFALLVSVLVGLLIYSVIRRRLQTVRRNARIDKQLAELELKGLHAQMNPHFIFNALNSIKDMILHDEKDNASRYLSKFARLIRLNLEHSQQAFISLNENIDYLQHYLGMEQLRFADLTYEIQTDPSINTNETFLPPMLLQPLVENAIWHGLLEKKGEKVLKINFRKEKNALLCEIEDNGIGINSSLNKNTFKTHHSRGIENIHHRMKVLNEKYKLQYLLTIKDKAEIIPSNGTGTVAILSLPLNSTN